MRHVFGKDCNRSREDVSCSFQWKGQRKNPDLEGHVWFEEICVWASITNIDETWGMSKTKPKRLIECNAGLLKGEEEGEILLFVINLMLGHHCGALSNRHVTSIFCGINFRYMLWRVVLRFGLHVAFKKIFTKYHLKTWNADGTPNR